MNPPDLPPSASLDRARKETRFCLILLFAPLASACVISLGFLIPWIQKMLGSLPFNLGDYSIPSALIGWTILMLTASFWCGFLFGRMRGYVGFSLAVVTAGYGALIAVAQTMVTCGVIFVGCLVLIVPGYK